MALGDQLKLPFLMGMVANHWKCKAYPRLERYFDMDLAGTDRMHNSPIGAWPEITDYRFSVPSGKDVFLRVELYCTLRDTWLCAIDRKLVIAVDIPIGHNRAEVHVKNTRYREGHSVTLSKDTFREVCDVIVTSIDKLREDLRVKRNGKRLQHVNKIHFAIWSALQTFSTNDKEHRKVIEPKTKARSNPMNAVVHTDRLSPDQWCSAIERTVQLMHETKLDREMLVQLQTEICWRGKLTFGEYLEHMKSI